MVLDEASPKRPARRRAARLAAGALIAVVATAGAALSGVGSSAAAPSLPRPGTPVLGASITIAPLHGTVRVAWPGDGWITATGPTSLPLGTAIGAGSGSLLVTFARDAGHGTTSASFGGGEFTVAQTRSGTTTVSLAGRPPADCVVGATSDRGFVLRRLYGDDTSAPVQLAAADAVTYTTRATWLVEDRCNGTEVSVRTGRVTVRRTRLARGAKVRLATVRAGQTILFAGPPPPGSLRAAPPKPSAPGSSGSSGGGSTGSSGSGSAPSSGGTTGTSSPPTPSSPTADLAALTAQVTALDIPGQAGQDLATSLSTVQSALAAANTSQACAGLGDFGAAVFEAVGASTSPLPASAATKLFDAGASIENELNCSTPSPTDNKASDEILGIIESIETLGLDPTTAGELEQGFSDVGAPIAYGDSSDACTALSFLSLVLGSGPSGISSSQSATLLNDLTPIENELNCSASSSPSL